MLFSSSEFIVFFLPIVLGGFALLTRFRQQRLAAFWVMGASLVFYGWWSPIYVPLLLASMVFNFALGRRLAARPSKWVLLAGVTANLVLLGYFKYTGFAVRSVDQLFGLDWAVPNIALPLAISFFTFQQIAFLSDAYDGAAEEPDFANYSLFITFFPHLIAGPITHHREMLPQFRDPNTFRPRLGNLAVGTTLFLLGLFKKVVLADPMGEIARPIFATASEGATLPLLDSWCGALAYAIQIYFDFSGYTDMAIGLGLMFGISLPPNFDSPYKARSIIEFWSRWHMTLTRFLTAYIYNPLVLRLTRARLAAGRALPRPGRTTPAAFAILVAAPTILTMFISGLWHGAGWQFIVFGLLHGLYLTVNHGWRAIKTSFGWRERAHPLSDAASVLLTFLCVVVAMVFFRASDVQTAVRILSGMAGSHGIVLHPSLLELPGVGLLSESLRISVTDTAYLTSKRLLPIAVMLIIIWSTPNTQQWLRHYRTAFAYVPRQDWLQRLVPRMVWRPSAAAGVLIGVIAALALVRTFSQAPTEFLYFQF